MDRLLILTVTAIAFLLPFERLGSFSLVGMNVRPSQIALALAWFFFIGRRVFTWRKPAFLALAGFFAVAGLSLLNAENLPRSLVVLAFTGFTASLALLLPNVLKSEASFARARAAVLLSAAIVSLFGLWQFVADMLGAPLWMTGLRETYSRGILGFTRLQATAAEPLYFANYLLLPLALGVTWLPNAPKKWRLPLAALIGLILLDLFLTSSRGGWLGLGVTAGALFWQERRRLTTTRFWSAVIFCVAAVAAGALLMGSFFSQTRDTTGDIFFKHVSTITDGAAYDDRTKTIASALEAWKLHPWIGVGIGGYGPFVSTFAYSKPEAGWSIVNNQTVELLAETGVLGLMTFCIFIFTIFQAAARRSASQPSSKTELSSACVAALLGMLAQYQTFSTLYIMHVWFTIGLLIASSSNDD